MRSFTDKTNSKIEKTKTPFFFQLQQPGQQISYGKRIRNVNLLCDDNNDLHVLPY